MSYRFALVINGGLFAGLFAVLCFAPDLYLAAYGIERTDSAIFIARRASPMFLGLAFMMWAIRDADPSPVRNAVTDGTALLLLGITATGIYALATGAVGPSILVGAAVEISFAAALFAVRGKAP